ncbi:YeiH family protein [Paenibacillus humicola]|uniref:YeiH family protein n=1 Tax=Paenibacillus humicola TaxID=3110540 RepID=UPI00237B0EA1|nr:putative sulfate exporter family transporter [Paenibacillus humicola]
MAGGIAFTLLVALAGYGLSRIPGLDRVGQLACAILLAVLFRQLFGYPEQLRPGIQFAGKRLLRAAIVLYGLKLNVSVIVHQGLGLLLRDIGTVAFAIAVTLLIAKKLRADMPLSLLLGIGTGICGAAAIAAVSPILRSKEEDTAVGAWLIALVGTVFAVGYTVVRPLLPLTDGEYGIWSGVSLHEIAHVALAAAPAGPDALAVAMLAKLGRVLLLVPLSFGLMAWMRRKGRNAEPAAKIEFPWFLIGFILMSLFGTYGFGGGGIAAALPGSFMNGLAVLTTFLLTMAMAGLGLNVNLRGLRAGKLKALAALSAASVLLSALTFFSI